jgi:hypothetical protein
VYFWIANFLGLFGLSLLSPLFPYGGGEGDLGVKRGNSLILHLFLRDGGVPKGLNFRGESGAMLLP